MQAAPTSPYWRPPGPSLATRIPSRRSRFSARSSIVGGAEPIDTAEDIERAERDLAISFSWAKPDPEVSSTGRGLFAKVMPAGDGDAQAEPGPEAVPDGTKARANPKHRMED